MLYICVLHIVSKFKCANRIGMTCAQTEKIKTVRCVIENDWNCRTYCSFSRKMKKKNVWVMLYALI